MFITPRLRPVVARPGPARLWPPLHVAGTLSVEVVAMATGPGRGRAVRTGAALVAALAVALLTGCTATTGVEAAPASVAAPPDGPSAPSGQQRALPLYYVTDTPAGPRLAREFRRLAVGGDPAAAGSAAVAALLAAPGGTVPGHRNAWAPGSALASPVTHADGVVTVDLTTRAADAAPADPLLAVQQLVYTVTGALGTTDPVRLLVAGKSVPRIWNDGVVTGTPVARADPLGVRVLVGIDEPAEGATVPSPLRVSGEAAVFEATLHWEVRQGGEVVRSGTASTAEGQRFAPYAFSVALPPGNYEVRVLEDDPSDGAGRPVMTDTRRVTVTG
jgi:Immunoglobulin-like domain of bacterial spore germination/Sporulation and spore germination